MDGKGRWMDNVFIERLWRSLKYECVYLLAFESGAEARNGIGAWMKFFGAQRPHSALAGLMTPDEAYAGARLSTNSRQQKMQKTATETGGLTAIEPSLIPPPRSLTNGAASVSFSSDY